MLCILCLQVPGEVWDHGGEARLWDPPGVRLDKVAQGGNNRVRGVPTIRHEEETGSALQGTRRVPPWDPLERHHGVRLPWEVEDVGETERWRLRRRERGVIHSCIRCSGDGARWGTMVHDGAVQCWEHCLGGQQVWRVTVSAASHYLLFSAGPPSDSEFCWQWKRKFCLYTTEGAVCCGMCHMINLRECTFSLRLFSSRHRQLLRRHYEHEANVKPV